MSPHIIHPASCYRIHLSHCGRLLQWWQEGSYSAEGETSTLCLDRCTELSHLLTNSHSIATCTHLHTYMYVLPLVYSSYRLLLCLSGPNKSALGNHRVTGIVLTMYCNCANKLHYQKGSSPTIPMYVCVQ